MAGSFASASTQYLSVASMPITAYPYTMACWFWATADSDQTLLSLQDNAVVNRYHRIVWGGASTDDIQFGAAEGGAVASAFATATPSKSTWNHACAVGASSTSRKIYLNGGNSGSSTSLRNWGAKNTITIGAYDLAGAGGYYDGYVAEVAIWDAALDANEVYSLGLGMSPRAIRPGSLVFYAPLVRTLTNDIVGGLTLTNNGTVAVAAHPRIYMPRGPKARRFTTAAGTPATAKRRRVAQIGSTTINTVDARFA